MQILNRLLNQKYFLPILVVFVLILGLVFFTFPKKNLSLSVGAKFSSNKQNWFFPKLHNTNIIDNIAKIVIENQNEVLTIVHDNNDWVILEKDNYPALTTRVKELVFGLSDLKIVDPKTKDPENFAALDLKNIDKSSNTTRVTLLDQNKNEIESIYLGKKELIASPNANYETYIFVRKPLDQQVWLVAGNLPESLKFKDLVKQPLVNFELSKIMELKLIKTKGPKNYICIKRNTINGDLHLADLPKGIKLKDQYIVDNIVQQFTYLNYEDVIKEQIHGASSVLSGEISILIGEPAENSNADKAINTLDKSNLKKVNFEIVHLNNSYYFKLLNINEVPNKHKWIYKISDYTFQTLLINKNDLLEQA